MKLIILLLFLGCMTTESTIHPTVQKRMGKTKNVVIISETQKNQCDELDNCVKDCQSKFPNTNSEFRRSKPRDLEFCESNCKEKFYCNRPRINKDNQ